MLFRNKYHKTNENMKLRVKGRVGMSSVTDYTGVGLGSFLCISLQRFNQLCFHFPVQLSAPRMSIKPSKTTIDITLDLPLEYSIHREYHAVVQYDLTYRPTWSNAVEQVGISNSLV